MPRRSIAPGKDIGLSIMLNVEKDEYYCTGTESVGFKVMLSVSLFTFRCSIQTFVSNGQSTNFKF